MADGTSPKHARTEENVTLTAVNKLVLSQEEEPQTHRSTRQVSRDEVEVMRDL